jgi:polyisoprenyl-phosphate glycosyltransferase
MNKIISIVIPAYNESGNMEELSRQLKDVFLELPVYDFEVIVVENGSTDNTYKLITQIRESDKRFKILQLSRNFRMDGGITAGLSFAKGDAIVIMTANLQDKPSTIIEFVKKWEEGYENIFGIVKSRPGKSVLRRFNSWIFYKIIKFLTGNMIPENVSDFRLIDRKILKIINSMEERNRFIRGMIAWTGFKSIGVEYERAPRYSGNSHAHFFKVLQLAIQGIFAFSYFPIRAIVLLGFSVSALSFIFLVYIVVKTIVYGVPFAGYGTIMTIISMMFGMVFLILGVLGQYIAQIYEEAKKRPNFIVTNKIGIDND